MDGFDETAWMSGAKDPTALLVLSNGDVYEGQGVGATGTAVGEVCFNTSMTGYQEILTDPSYAEQLITFTFPHVGNVGTNDDDNETGGSGANGLILRAAITDPSNFRSTQTLGEWLKSRNLVGISGVDTRRLTRAIRLNGAPNGIIAHMPDGRFDIPALQHQATTWPGLEGMDVAISVTCKKSYEWSEAAWELGKGFAERKAERFHVIAIDYGIKHNILRCLAGADCRITVVPATMPASEILAFEPDGIFLSNGPGDPAATGKYAVPILKELIASGLPVFGICLGHQLLALALGGKTEKMYQGHRGANHPVKDLITGKVEITCMNHGFVVAKDSLPKGVSATHFSLFDGTLAGLQVDGLPIFSVQYHPEASPGPQDSHYLFDRFIKMMEVATENA